MEYRDVLDQYVTELLESNDIYIHNCDYKKSGNYAKIKYIELIYGDEGTMTVDEYIERFLLTKHELLDTYESDYDMGNPYELDDDECNISAVAYEIIKQMDPSSEAEIAAWGKSKESRDIKAAREARGAQAEEAKELVHTLTRKDGGYIERLKNHLSLNLGLLTDTNIDSDFDSDPVLDLDLPIFNDNEVNRREKVKILYFFYMVENRDFRLISDDLKTIKYRKNKGKERERFNVLEFFSNPSMENIDYSFFDLETFNGKIIKFIKNSLGKELSLSAKGELNRSLQEISIGWDEFLRNTIFRIDLIGSQYGDDLVKAIDLFLLQPVPEIFVHSDGFLARYIHSPIETLYLKVLQHEYICHTQDMLWVDSIQTTTDYDLPDEFVDIITTQHWRNVPISDVEKYIDAHAPELADIVWCNSESNKEKKQQNRDIRNHGAKVRRWIDFCIQSRLIPNIEDHITELLIISCLQTFILDVQQDAKKEFDDYKFHLHKIYVEKMPSAQAVLNSDGHMPDAQQIYWVHKVLDRLYANAGMYHVRKKLRDYVGHCYRIIERIMTCPNVRDMLELHQYYINYQKIASDRLIALDKQAKALLNFQLYLQNKGFQFVDDRKDIHYVFTCSAETEYIYNSLATYVEAALIYKKPSLHIQIKAADHKKYLTFDISPVFEPCADVAADENVAFDFKLIFDYQNNTCAMSEFKIRGVQ